MNIRNRRNCMSIVTLSIVLILCLSLAFALTACNNDGEEEIPTHEHNWETTVYDKDNHKNVCSTCGAINLESHSLDGNIDDSVDKLMKCDCGYSVTVGEYYSYKVNFECSEKIALLIYDTQNYSEKVTNSTLAYARDGETGKLVNSGKGEVNFEVNAPFGYKLKDINISVESNTGYEDILEPNATGRNNTYRITNITNELKVKVEWEIEIDCLNLPVMIIDTENSASIYDKENYVTCSISLVNAEQEYCFEDKSAGIRLRGNTTFNYPKKPYRIKFDKKQSLFGWEKNKSWVLLALYQDFSNIKDYSAFKFASAISTEDSAFVPNARHIEVYLNGEYMGIYLLTDQVQENSGRTGVETDFDENCVEIPFLVEWDEYAEKEGIEDIDWFKIINEDSGATSFYNVKYPEPDQRFSQSQFEYINNYIITVNSLCHDIDVTKDRFEEYVDLPSFIDYYLVQELMGQIEINKKSIYMSKSINGKLVMGPIWDFDWAVGGPMSESDGILLAENEGWFSDTNWFYYMLKKEWFQSAVLTRWNEIKPTLTNVISQLREYKKDITDVSERNAILWDFDTDDSLLDFAEYYDWVMSYFEKRINQISKLLEIY